MNGKLSDLGEVNFGVPQRSCLGPLLFIIYINDILFSIKHSEVNMHADDTSLSFCSKNVLTINDRVYEDLKCVKIWLAGNKLSINVATTNSLVIGSRKKLKDIQCPLAIKPSFAISGEGISIMEQTKYLGVKVDQYMNWENHIDHVMKRFQGP